MNIPGYRMERELGHGGMSTVYLAEQESLGRKVALKVMAPALAADRSFGERFLKEGRTVAHLSHPNILAVHDIGSDGHHYYMVMEYVPGGDLKHRIRQGGLPPEQALAILRQTAAALGYAHGKGFVHRDVKPENILFREDGTAVLSDFGIAKAVGSGTKMTGTGMSIGTPHYMSPEQARGREVDGRSDLYSLGVVLYEMLTGRVPFDAEDTLAIAYSHVNDPVPQLPDGLAGYQPLLDLLLAKNPAHRYAEAAELVEAIDLTLAGKAPSPPRSKPAAALKTQVMKAPPSASSKGSGLKWAIGGALLAALVAGGFVLTNGSKPRPVLGGGGAALPAASRAGAGEPAAVVPQVALGKGRAILMVASEPDGAEVYLDEHRLGVTPLTREDLPAGTYSLKLTQKYYDDAAKEVALEDDKVQKHRMTLKRGRGDITILTDPSGALVYLDGKKQKEKTPLTLSAIGAGAHTLKVHLDKYYDAEREVEVMSDRTAKVHLALKGGHLLAYKGDWLEPEEAAKRKGADEERERQRVAEQKRREEEARKRAEEEARLAEGQKRSKFAGLVEAGRSAIEREEKEAAVGKLREALALYPGDGEAKALLARAEKILVKTFTDPTTGMDFVLVPGGCYQMGSNSGASDEKPVHEVCVDDFYIGKYEVTQGQYQAITGSNPSRFKGSDRPVEKVSWNDAQDFIRKLNPRSDKTYRLPTEAEWEYAARSGGKREKYAGGDNVDAVAWYGSNSGGQTHPVGRKAPNSLGLYDMSGNVWEWCQDWYDRGYYGKSPKDNPQGPSGGSNRIARGGSWGYDPWYVRSALRFRFEPGFRGSLLGFRLALPTGH
jgi:formylglycine-generating enzyme required for sulfatase activity